MFHLHAYNTSALVASSSFTRNQQQLGKFVSLLVVRTSKAKKLSASGAPDFLTGGSGEAPDPHYRLALRARHILPKRTNPSKVLDPAVCSHSIYSRRIATCRQSRCRQSAVMCVYRGHRPQRSHAALSKRQQRNQTQRTKKCVIAIRWTNGDSNAAIAHTF